MDIEASPTRSTKMTRPLTIPRRQRVEHIMLRHMWHLQPPATSESCLGVGSGSGRQIEASCLLLQRTRPATLKFML
jgi:hypothetical protein